QTSDIVAEGKLVSHTAYQQRNKKYTEIEISTYFENIPLSAKIDFYDVKNKVVHEVKKSDKLEQAHIAQVQFYLYVLEKNGLQGVSAILEYPKLRQTLPIPPLTEEVSTEIETWIQEIEQVLHQKHAPVAVKKTYCKNCSFYDFCFVKE
ncbi:MAG: CRISPR-associated protein Cas4, partial [Raineya sp.]|nr:CRISPR-associated protein Cas4 [Raineya sp.]